MMYLQRPELMREADPLPSHYWEPQPDEEDLDRMRMGYEAIEKTADDEKLPFI